MVLDFNNFCVNIEVPLGLIEWRHSYNWLVDSKLFKILSWPTSQTVYDRNFSFFMKRVFVKGRGFGFVSNFNFIWLSHRVTMYHFGRGWLFVSFKHYPARLLPNVTIKLLLAIKSCHVDSADTHNIANLHNMWKFAYFVCEELNARKCCCCCASQSRGFQI